MNIHPNGRDFLYSRQVILWAPHFIREDLSFWKLISCLPYRSVSFNRKFDPLIRFSYIFSLHSNNLVKNRYNLLEIKINVFSRDFSQIVVEPLLGLLHFSRPDSSIKTNNTLEAEKQGNVKKKVFVMRYSKDWCEIVYERIMCLWIKCSSAFSAGVFFFMVLSRIFMKDGKWSHAETLSSRNVSSLHLREKLSLFVLTRILC